MTCKIVQPHILLLNLDGICPMNASLVKLPPESSTVVFLFKKKSIVHGDVVDDYGKQNECSVSNIVRKFFMEMTFTPIFYRYDDNMSFIDVFNV